MAYAYCERMGLGIRVCSFAFKVLRKENLPENVSPAWKCSFTSTRPRYNGLVSSLTLPRREGPTLRAAVPFSSSTSSTSSTLDAIPLCCL